MIRPLGALENYFALSAAKGGSMNLCVIRFRGNIAADKLKSAIDQWQEQFFSLQLTLIPTDAPTEKNQPNFQFAFTQQAIPLNICYRNNDNTWKDTTSTELYTAFSIEHQVPLVRVTWLQNPADLGPHELIIKYHPSIIDGRSAYQLSHHLLHLYHRLHYQQTLPNNTSRLLPACEDLIKPHLEARQIPSNCILPHRPLEDLKSIHHASFPYPQETRWLSFHLPMEQTYRLLKHCTQRQLPVECALTAACQLAIRQACPTINHIPMVTSQDIDLREFNVSIPETSIGCLSSILQYAMNVDAHDSLWDTALQVKKAKAYHLKHYGHSSLPIYDSSIDTLPESDNENSLKRYSLLHHHHHTLKHQLLTLPIQMNHIKRISGQHTEGSIFSVNTSLYKDQLTGTVCYVPALVGNDAVKAIVESVLIKLANL